MQGAPLACSQHWVLFAEAQQLSHRRTVGNWPAPVLSSNDPERPKGGFARIVKFALAFCTFQHFGATKSLQLFLLTIGGFLLAIECLCLQCFGVLYLQLELFFLTIGAFLLTIVAFCSQYDYVFLST